MLKAVGPLFIGSAVGIAIAVYSSGHRLSSADSSASPFAVASGTRDAYAAGERTATQPSPDRYLNAWRDAERYFDADDIANRLAELFAEPYSIDRDAHIAALFERLAGIDLGRAIRIAQTPGFDSQLIADVLRTLATTDTDAAIRALVAVRNPALQADLAVAVLKELGNNARNLEMIADALPEHQRVNLQIEALGALAQVDPEAALDTALALSDAGVRNAAAQRIGVEWVHQDPARAFSMRNSLPNELREGYRDAVAVEWARLDSDSFLDFADTQPEIGELILGLMHTIGVAPERTFTMAQGKPPQRIIGNFGARYTVERTAFMNAALLDIDGYIALVQSLPEGQRKQDLVISLAESYGRVRPDEGIAWAMSLNYPQAESVVAGQAYLSGYDVSYRILEELYARYNQPGLVRNVASNTGRAAAGMPNRAEIASELLQKDDPVATMVLNQLVRVWLETDAEEPLEWMLDSGASIDPSLAMTMAARLAGRDASRAAAYAERMPPELKQAWLEQVAPAFASQDPEAAAIWLTRFQGEPGYDNIYRRVVQQMAQVDPQGTAIILASASPDLQRALARNVANGLAQTSLPAAAQWASGLRDNDARALAVSQVANDWAYRDPVAAQRWVGSLPRGDVRDQALSTLLGRLSSNGFHQTVAPELLDAFESDQVRDQGVSALVRTVAVEDPEYARELMDEWISDPVLREQARQAIESSRE